ncbi:Carcinoembryonic antigen-related cell adhesion molecule 19 [Vulpes lagopus]
MLFTYFPDLQQPQRDGSATGQHDIVGFPNGSMLLHRVQPTDSGTYQVAVTINPAWIMRAKTEVQVAKKHKELPIIHLPVSAGIMAAIMIGSLAAGSLFIGCIAHLQLTGGWRGQSHRMTPTEKPEAHPNLNAGDQHIYEVMPSPTHLVSPPGAQRPRTTPCFSMGRIRPLPQQQPEPENHPYQDLLNPDPAPYCQLTPTP